MFKEVLGFLEPGPGDILLDATAGGGGHAGGIAARIRPGGILIAIDSDEEAIARTGKALMEFQDTIRLIKDNFRNLDAVLAKERVAKLDGALFDLGVSSYQLEDEKRGFGIKAAGRLDMRMDRDLRLSAYDVVNKYREDVLSELISRYGEERFHRRVARFIVEARARKPIETTAELVCIIHKAVASRYGRTKIDPATRTFQAIRIAVNDELAALEEGLKKAISWLDFGSRICVISFHSLEDRIVKNIFRGYAKLGVLKILTKKPIRPSPEEVAANPRARSAKLRAAERIK